jgi:uncharacterized protein (DUF58 family)
MRRAFYKNLFVHSKIFFGVAAVVMAYFLAFYVEELEILGDALLLLFIALCFVDLILLFLNKDGIVAKRHLPELFSLADPNPVKLELESKYTLPMKLEIIDELPFQFETRDFHIETSLGSKERKDFDYELTPYTRGEYNFGTLNLFVSNRFPGFFQRRIVREKAVSVKVFPSVIQMRQMELKAFARLHETGGIKKIRRIGHSYEFDQISEYVQGDDYRSVNWKATGRTNTLMVNRYEDERSQPVYCLVDASRSMKMPFNQLSLLDYAINSALVISNIALKKSDKAGLITFSDKIRGVLKAQNSPVQLTKILNTLYKLDQSATESDYEQLYHVISKTASVRGLLFLFTNFESLHALQRVKHILGRLNKQHLLVVIFFENTEISTFARRKSRDIEAAYEQTISQDYLYQKELMVRELNALRIQTILTPPEKLSISVINKYLELKARGMI